MLCTYKDICYAHIFAHMFAYVCLRWSFWANDHEQPYLNIIKPMCDSHDIIK